MITVGQSNDFRRNVEQLIRRHADFGISDENESIIRKNIAIEWLHGNRKHRIVFRVQIRAPLGRIGL